MKNRKEGRRQGKAGEERKTTKIVDISSKGFAITHRQDCEQLGLQHDRPRGWEQGRMDGSASREVSPSLAESTSLPAPAYNPRPGLQQTTPSSTIRPLGSSVYSVSRSRSVFFFLFDIHTFSSIRAPFTVRPVVGASAVTHLYHPPNDLEEQFREHLARSLARIYRQ